MSLIKKSLVAASCCLGTLAYAQEGYYVSLGAGLGKVMAAKSKQDFPLLLKSPAILPSPIDQITLNFKRSLHLNAAIGYQWGEVRAELSPVFLKAKYKKFEQKPNDFIFADDLSGQLQTLAVFINGYYDFAFNETWAPYLGAGLGYARIKNRLSHSDLVDAGGHPLPTLKFTMTNRLAAYQLIPGVKVYLTPAIALAADYRWSSTFSKMKALNSRLRTHALNMSVLYHF